MQQALDHLLEQPGIWRANDPRIHPDQSAGTHIPTGFRRLDAVLPGGGLPSRALTEILHGQHGIGELQVVMPALARLSRGGRWIALIAPPFIPYAPALAASGMDLSRVLVVHPGGGEQALWSVEQALQLGTCAAVLAWPSQCDDRSLRRLQLAAEAGDSLGLLFRGSAAASQRSPAALRLALERSRSHPLEVKVLKCRGIPAGRIQLNAEPTGPATASRPVALAHPASG